ncbi:perakine reductase-like [Syzygium oleosum]|uniref:perakine reductase-like n=1 Tax=Syzygium oleosum TaxID=219896 RepID=UPI0024B91872|nr:perakine reductase-like [Syzygium oleosum]
MEEKQRIQIPRVKLGSRGLEVSRLSGVLNAPVSHKAGCLLIKRAFEKGITFFDTADVYSNDHHSEIMIGKALKELPREQIQLAMKFGIARMAAGQFAIRGTPNYVRECCEGSLRRLGVDYIDLYYQHRVDTTVAIEDTMGELKKLVEEGKIKYIGLSEASIDTIKRAHTIHPITAVQMEYSLWTREIEDELIPLCRELGIGIVAYSPLGHGFFGGKAAVESLPAESLLAMHPRFTGENLEKNKVIYRKVVDLAAKHGCTAPQLALAWLLHQENDVIPIPGTRKAENLEDNIGSVAIKLSEDEMREIRDVVTRNEVSCEREMEVFTKYTWRYANTPAR